MSETGLSLSGELLWLAMDPASGEPPRRRARRRLLNALAAARLADHPGSSQTVAPGWRAARSAHGELVMAGLAEPTLLLRNMRLLDRRTAGLRFYDLWQAIEAGELQKPRDQQLAVLLASAGVLAPRLTRDERWIAWRRLKAAMAADGSGVWLAPLAGGAPLSDGIAALGRASLTGIEHLVDGALHDLGHSAFGGHDGGGHHSGGHPGVVHHHHGGHDAGGNPGN